MEWLVFSFLSLSLSVSRSFGLLGNVVAGPAVCIYMCFFGSTFRDLGRFRPDRACVLAQAKLGNVSEARSLPVAEAGKSGLL